MELLKLGTRATVLSVNKDGSLQIQAGIMKLTVKPQEVYVLPQQDTQNTVKKFVEKANRQLRNLATSSEVDLRGMTADERFPCWTAFWTMPCWRSFRRSAYSRKGYRRTQKGGAAAPEAQPADQIGAAGRLWRRRGRRDHCGAGCISPAADYGDKFVNL